MNTRIQPNDKPVYEIDANVVLRLSGGDNVIQQFELTRDDLSIFIDDVLDPKVREPFDDQYLCSWIDLETGGGISVMRHDDEILVWQGGARFPAHLSLDQARTLVRKLKSAADCFDIVPGLNSDDEEFISEEGDKVPTSHLRLATKGNHQRLSEIMAAKMRCFESKI